MSGSYCSNPLVVNPVSICRISKSICTVAARRVTLSADEISALEVPYSERFPVF
jgi:hypothetical protein